MTEELVAVGQRFSRTVTALASAAAVSLALVGPAPVVAQEPTAFVEWGVWVAPDGCMHWWADGADEGYMVNRVNPQTGLPVCLKVNTCLVENTDTLFATDSAHLTADGRARLENFFASAGAFGYAIYGHTDSRASDEYNIGLSQRRVASVADVARSQGAVVQREIGFGERNPIASNDTEAGMQQNRRVEVICYRW
jgi:outer membrane protein OmpA-like peptidoglycan-associated protein